MEDNLDVREASGSPTLVEIALSPKLKAKTVVVEGADFLEGELVEQLSVRCQDHPNLESSLGTVLNERIFYVHALLASIPCTISYRATAIT